MQLHKNCGGEVVTYCQYSDADKDYYASSCVKCCKPVKLRDVEYAEESHQVSLNSYQEYRTVQMLEKKVAVLERLATALFHLSPECRKASHPVTSCPKCTELQEAEHAVRIHCLSSLRHCNNKT